jgi:hypothetical protein
MIFSQAVLYWLLGFLFLTLGKASNIPIGTVAYGSLGTSAVHVAGSIYAAEQHLTGFKTVTGLGMLNGATVGTDNLIYLLLDANGKVLATTALAGTLSAGANAFQQIAFTAPISLKPGRYFIALQCNGTTATTRRIAASTYLNFASVTAGTFGTGLSVGTALITPPTTTAADAGPIGYMY